MLWHGAKHNLYIRQPKIRIQNNHPLPQLAELNGKVNGRIGFSNSSLSAGDSDDSG